MSSKQFDIKNQFCLGVYCGVQPLCSPSTRSVASTATRDGSAVGGSLGLQTCMHPIPDRAVRTIDTQQV